MRTWGKERRLTMAWDVSSNASAKEKLKAEYADHIAGMNSCGVIDYYAYCKLFDLGMDILDRMYELGHKEEV